ncbi:hypothetical protein JCM9279_002737 [Rhodotorula babjevae]
MPRTDPVSSLAELSPPQLLRRSPRMADISTSALDPAVPRPTRDRAASLLASLANATGVVQRIADDSSSFGALSLALFDKVIGELDGVVRLVQEAAAVDAGDQRTSLAQQVEKVGLVRPSTTMGEDGGRELEKERHDEGGTSARRSLRHDKESDGRDEPRRRNGRPRHEQRHGTLDDLTSSGEPRRHDDVHEQRRSSRVEDVRPASSARGHRDDPPQHERARAGPFRSRASPIQPTSPISTSRKGFVGESRSASRATSRAFSPPPPASAPPRPKSRSSAAAPRRDEHEPHIARSNTRDELARRPKSRSSAASSRHEPAHEPLPPRRPSSRSRFVADSSASDNEEPVRRSRLEEADEGPGRARSRSKARSSARSYSGRSDDARRALELASAPPPPSTGSDSGDEGQARRSSSAPPMRLPPVLAGARTAAAIVRAVVAQGAAGDKAGLLALSLVSREYREAAMPVLYRAVVVASRRQLELLLRTVDSAPSLGALIYELKVQPLDADLPTPSPETLVDPLKRLINGLPNLTSLDEDFTTGDWDVGDLSTGHDYPLTVSSPCKSLVRFRSAKAWFEIGALFALLQSQPHFVELVIGGAAMDRDWVGAKLLSALSSSSPSSPPPAVRLESLEIAQVMHEDTLAVLLRATGGSSVGRLSSVRIGFQSLGTSDDDTPLASIPAALAVVGSSVTHLALAAPRKASDDSSALLDEVVAVLPRIEVLEWTEATDLAPLPLARAPLLGRLPSSLRVLRARSLVSLSTSAVLSFLHGDAPRALQVLDIQWAHGPPTGDDLVNEPWFKARHVARIEDAAAELGIECHVAKGDEALALGRA